MGLDEAIAELLTSDVPAVVAALQNKAQPLYREIFNQGHNAGVGATTRTMEKLNGELKTVTDARDAIESELKDLRTKTPDVAKITEQSAEQIKELKRAHKEELATLRGEFSGSTRDRALADLRSELLSLGVDKDYAQILVEKEETKKRVKTSDDGKTFSLLQAGKEIPIPVDDGKSAIRAMAEELKIATPQKFVVSTTDRGSGTGAGSGGSGTGNGTNKYDAIRAKVKADVAAAGAAPNRDTAVRTALGMAQPK